MAKINLRCTCGFMFFVDEERVKTGSIQCPSCLAPVGIDGPVAGAPARPAIRILTTGQGASTVPWKPVILGASAVGIVGLVILIFALSGGEDRKPRSPYDRPADDSAARRTPPAAKVPAFKVIPPTVDTPPPPDPVAKPPDPAPKRPPTDPARPATPPPPGPRLSDDLLKEVRSELLSLPPFYLGLVLSPKEKARVESIAASGEGGKDEVSFLGAILGGLKLRAVRAEANLVEDRLAKLSTEALEGAPMDKVVMNDGRVLNGWIKEESPETVKVERKTTTGVGGVMSLKRSEIKEVLKGKGAGAEFKTRWEAVRKGGAERPPALLAWCKANGLAQQAQLVACLILKTDPGSPEARAELGLPADPVKRAEEVASAGGAIAYDGKEYTPKELMDKLLRDGNILIDGQWYTKKDRMIGLAGLFRQDKQAERSLAIIPSATALTYETETTYRVVQDVTTKTFVEQPEVRQVRRFFAVPMSVETMKGSPPGGVRVSAPSTPVTSMSEVEIQSMWDSPDPAPNSLLTGEVAITVSVGQPIIEASVIAQAQVKSTGSITFFLAEGQNRTRLFQCAPKEDSSHKLPDSVRGKTEVTLVAVFNSKASYTPKTERRRIKPPKRDGRIVLEKGLEVVHHRLIPEYHAMLFPSNSNTIEVFRFRAAVGEPAAGLNALFEKAGALEILKQ